MAQNLIGSITITNLAARATITVANPLRDQNNSPVAPDAVIPDRTTGTSVIAATATNITFYNACDRANTVVFSVIKFHSTQGSPAGQFLGVGSRQPGILYNSYAPLTYGNSNVETSLLSSTCEGSTLLPENFFEAGRVLSARTRGYISTDVGQTARMRFKLDGVDLIDNTGTLPNNLSNFYIESVFDLVCYSSGVNGHIRGSGRTFIQVTTGVAGSVMRPLVMTSDSIVNTTIPLQFDMTYQWTNALAANSVTIVYASVESLNV